MAIQMLLKVSVQLPKSTRGGTMKFQKNLYRLTALAALALTFAFSARIMRAQSADSEEISKLLVQARAHALELEDDAADLDAITRSKLSWKQHANKLERMRE